jgi:hypothetical protein
MTHLLAFTPQQNNPLHLNLALRRAPCRGSTGSTALHSSFLYSYTAILVQLYTNTPIHQYTNTLYNPLQHPSENITSPADRASMTMCVYYAVETGILSLSARQVRRPGQVPPRGRMNTPSARSRQRERNVMRPGRNLTEPDNSPQRAAPSICAHPRFHKKTSKSQVIHNWNLISWLSNFLTWPV